MRLVLAQCTVDYAGRLTAHLPSAVRLVMVKADGCVAVHADGGAYKPLNWMNAPNTLVEDDGRLDGDQPQGRDADDHARGGAPRHLLRLRRGPRACPRTGSKPICRSCWRRTPGAGRGTGAGPARVPDGARARSTCCAATRVAGRWRSRSSAVARSTASNSSPATWSASTAIRCCSRSAVCSPHSRSSRRHGCWPRIAASRASRSTTTGCAGMESDELKLF